MTQETKGQLSGYNDPKSYWEDRLSAYGNCRGTGHKRFSIDYNNAMYALAANRLERILQTNELDLRGKSVLDVGAGLGYFVNKFVEWGAADVTGIDITEMSVDYLSRSFPEYNFIKSDIASVNLVFPKLYDVIFAISVLFHIVDETSFNQAITNMSNAVVPGGCLILVDTFKRQFLPSARHTKFRSLHTYQQIFKRLDLNVVTIQPMYHIMGRSIIPFIGPTILSWNPLLRLLTRFDLWLEKNLKTNFGHLKFAVVRKTA